MSTTPTCTTGASGSSGPATWRGWSTSGSPALGLVELKLRAGASVADVGCGVSTILLVQAFPASTLEGFDYRVASIESARRRALEVGVADRVRFEVASDDAFAGAPNGLVAMYDCLYEMGDRWASPGTSASCSPKTGRG